MRRTEGGGWALTAEDRELTIFDPEKCLKVGKHYGRLGVVFEVPVKRGEVDYDGEWHRTTRGLLKWDGGPPELAKAAALLALQLAEVSSPSAWLTGRVVDGWRAGGLWQSLYDGLHLGKDLQAVAEVMQS